MHHEGDTITVSIALLLVDSYSKSCITMAEIGEYISSVHSLSLWYVSEAPGSPGSHAAFA